MDSETLPLLNPVAQEVRYRRFRPLTYEEVQHYRSDIRWTRTRCLLVFLFWCILASSLSIVACLLASARCQDTVIPTVPPVHMTLAPLMSRVIDGQPRTM